MAREGLVIDDFSGGLNNVVDPSLIAENEVADLRNLIISRTGKLISRPPIYKVGDYPVAVTSAKALGYYRNEDAVVFLVVATDSATYIYDLWLILGRSFGPMRQRTLLLTLSGFT